MKIRWQRRRAVQKGAGVRMDRQKNRSEQNFPFNMCSKNGELKDLELGVRLSLHSTAICCTSGKPLATIIPAAQEKDKI